MARPKGWIPAILAVVCPLLLEATPAIAAPGDAIWVATRNQDGGRDIFASSALSPDGTRLYVAGSVGQGDSADFATVAYDTMTGSEQWVATYDGGHRDRAAAIEMAANGTVVYVTGASVAEAGSGPDYVTVAYDASTGAELWVSRESRLGDEPTCVTATPDGAIVLVTGESGARRRTFIDYVTVAYDADTGNRLWKQRIGRSHFDAPEACSVAPDSSAFFITGQFTTNHLATPDVVTISYSALTGAELWLHRYDGRNGWDEGNDLAVSPDGSVVYVSGISNVGFDPDPLLLAYSAADGSLLWNRRRPTDWWEGSTNLAVAPDGATLFQLGENGERLILAYDATSGHRLWTSLDSSSLEWVEGESIASAPDGSTVYTTGSWSHDGSWGALTVAVDALTGEVVWEDFERPGTGWSILAAPDGSAVYSSGDTYPDSPDSLDLTTVAYET